jgi:hypothetical protein
MTRDTGYVDIICHPRVPRVIPRISPALRDGPHNATPQPVLTSRMAADSCTSYNSERNRSIPTICTSLLLHLIYGWESCAALFWRVIDSRLVRDKQRKPSKHECEYKGSVFTARAFFQTRMVDADFSCVVYTRSARPDILSRVLELAHF